MLMFSRNIREKLKIIIEILSLPSGYLREKIKKNYLSLKFCSI